jgi:hypothetical protein
MIREVFLSEKDWGLCEIEASSLPDSGIIQITITDRKSLGSLSVYVNKRTAIRLTKSIKREIAFLDLGV